MSNVLVDTCIWSLALRRKTSNSQEAEALAELIVSQRAQIIGPIRQEILSGINLKSQFTQLRNKLSAFPDLIIKTHDYECAAEFANTLRQKGIQGSTTDFLICAVAHRYSLPIFTADKDFEYFKKHLPIKLHQIKIQ